MLPKIKVGVKILNNVENVRRITLKKVSFFLLMIFLTVFLTACSGNDYISITEEESDAIAQYCSHLLIKYDKNHRDGIRLLDLKDLEKEIKEREKEAAANNPSPTPVPTEAPTPTEGPDAPPEDGEATPTLDTGEPVPTEVPEPECASIAEAGGIEGFTVDYVKHGLADSYTNAGEFYSFSAPKDKKLCVVEFSITNTSGVDAKFDAAPYKLAYKLVCEGGKSHGSEISLFADDIQFYNSTVKAGESAHATLIFYVAPDEVHQYLEVQGAKKFFINLK